MNNDDSIRHVALNYLTRRDHSQKELLQKLAKHYPIDDIHCVLHHLVETGWQICTNNTYKTPSLFVCPLYVATVLELRARKLLTCTERHRE